VSERIHFLKETKTIGRYLGTARIDLADADFSKQKSMRGIVSVRCGWFTGSPEFLKRELA
jgi:hypothetical protein